MKYFFRLSEAESIYPSDVVGSSRGKDTSNDEVLAQFGDSASFALQILAQVKAKIRWRSDFQTFILNNPLVIKLPKFVIHCLCY